MEQFGPAMDRLGLGYEAMKAEPRHHLLCDHGLRPGWPKAQVAAHDLNVADAGAGAGRRRRWRAGGAARTG